MWGLSPDSEGNLLRWNVVQPEGPQYPEDWNVGFDPTLSCPPVVTHSPVIPSTTNSDNAMQDMIKTLREQQLQQKVDQDNLRITIETQASEARQLLDMIKDQQTSIGSISD